MTNPEYARDLADELSCVRGDLEEASAEIERLRAALQRIAGSDTRPHAAGDIARQALSCERAQSEPSGDWQPIETAPKTRHAILVHCGDLQNTYAVLWDETPIDMRAGWFHWGADDRRLEEQPTHWMPLPKSPSEKSSGPSEDEAARLDRAYRDGARQAAPMAHQSLRPMDDWIADGCGNRCSPLKSGEKP